MPKSLSPIHPGEIIKEEILKPLDLSVRQLSAALSLTPARVNEIILGRRGITADTALRLAQFLGNSAEFWLNLQSAYELRIARNSSEKQIAREVKRHTAAA
jgi:addiction module HigA family antidote